MQGSVPGQDILDDRTRWSAFLDADHAKRYEAGLAKLARPYRLYGEEIVQSSYPPRNISASAGLVSNALDLSKYDAAIDHHTFIKAETQERAWTPAVSNGGRTLPYGLGWFIQQYQGLRLVWHYGYWNQFSSLYLKVPEKKISFILLANSDGLSAPFRSLGEGNVAGSAFANSFLRIFLFEDALGRALHDPHWSQPNDQFNKEVEQFVKQAGAYRYEDEVVSHNFLSRWLDERRNSARKEIKLDPKIYDRFVGRYEIGPGKSFNITKENDRLFINSVGVQNIEVFPESEDKFFNKVNEAQLRFVRDNEGRVTHAEIEDAQELRGQRIRAPKIK